MYDLTLAKYMYGLNNVQMRLWDLRQRQIVVDYPGHVNTCTRRPLHVDDTETIVYAGKYASTDRSDLFIKPNKYLHG